VKFAEADPNEGYFVTSYDEHTIQINGKNFHSSLVIANNALKTDWRPHSVETLCATDFKDITAMNPELVIIGTGSRLTFPPVEIYAELIKLGVGVEIMDTGAACRTFNVLTSEGRHAVCGLILPD